MLSYRHGFHAGNHADALKHLTLCLILRSLRKKDKPFFVIDTHSGGGYYSLKEGFALKNREFQTGIMKILGDQDLRALVPEYYEAVEALNRQGGLGDLDKPDRAATSQGREDGNDGLNRDRGQGTGRSRDRDPSKALKRGRSQDREDGGLEDERKHHRDHGQSLEDGSKTKRDPRQASKKEAALDRDDRDENSPGRAAAGKSLGEEKTGLDRGQSQGTGHGRDRDPNQALKRESSPDRGEGPARRARLHAGGKKHDPAESGAEIEEVRIREDAVAAAGYDLNLYPGSPYISAYLLREQDRLTLIDLHPDEYQKLSRRFGFDKRVKVEKTDGLKALNALLPPPVIKRGLIFIDPSYEIKSDYREVVKALKNALDKFEHGIYALWYPVLGRGQDHSSKLIEDLKALGKPLLQAELRVKEQSDEMGMIGSGMLIINYPYTIDESLLKVGARLDELIARPTGGSVKVKILNRQP